VLVSLTSTPTTELIDQLRTARRLPAPAACRAIRLASGATQQQIADTLDTNRVSVARWELGERSPRGELRLRYIALLDSLRETLIDPEDTSSPRGTGSAQTSVEALAGASPV